ncbi:MAG: hypothetical protein ACRET6_02625 [Burkholderiales bacterium]
MQLASHQDVESLLTREARAGLPLGQLLRLYLDPGSLFKDVSRGSAAVRRSALSYNRRMRHLLLPYIRRWMVIAAALVFAIFPAEALHAQTALSLVPAAAFAVAGTVAITVIACIFAGYLLLGAAQE